MKRPIESNYTSQVAYTRALEAYCDALAQPEQEPVACSVCHQVHSILDGDESKIIRNTKDGYPNGRYPRILTLQERVTDLCRYASDWKRWCLEKENTTPPQRKPLTDEQVGEIGRKYEKFDNRGNEFFARWGFARAIEAAHGIKE